MMSLMFASERRGHSRKARETHYPAGVAAGVAEEMHTECGEDAYTLHTHCREEQETHYPASRSEYLLSYCFGQFKEL